MGLKSRGNRHKRGAARVRLQTQDKVECVHGRAQLEILLRRPVAGRVKKLRSAGGRSQSITYGVHGWRLAQQALTQDLGTEIVLLTALPCLMPHPDQRDVLRAARMNVTNDGSSIDQRAGNHFVGAAGIREALRARVSRVNQGAPLQIDLEQSRR